MRRSLGKVINRVENNESFGERGMEIKNWYVLERGRFLVSRGLKHIERSR